MDFFEVVKKRHSIRAFKSQKIKEEDLKRIYETINSAPSAGNLQAYEVFVVEDKEILKRLVDASYGQDFISEAPIVLIFCANPDLNIWKYGSRGSNLYSIQDATIACSYAQLAVTALGLGSVWIGAFDEEKVKQILNLSPNLRPVAILPVGYPDETPQPTPRRSLDNLIKKIPSTKYK